MKNTLALVLMVFGIVRGCLLYTSPSPRDGLFETYSMNGQLKSRDCFKNDEKVDMSYCEE